MADSAENKDLAPGVLEIRLTPKDGELIPVRTLTGILSNVRKMLRAIESNMRGGKRARTEWYLQRMERDAETGELVLEIGSDGSCQLPVVSPQQGQRMNAER